MTKDADVGSVGGGNRKNKTIKRSSPTSKNSVGTMGYLAPKARLAFT